MSELRWTTETPTKSGWYWVRKSPEDYHVCLIQQGYISIVGNRTGPILLASVTDPLQFAGPIPQPKED